MLDARAACCDEDIVAYMSSTAFVVQWHCNDTATVSSSQITGTKVHAKAKQPAQQESTEIAERNVPTHAVFRCLHSIRPALLRKIDGMTRKDLDPMLDVIAGKSKRSHLECFVARLFLREENEMIENDRWKWCKPTNSPGVFPIL